MNEVISTENTEINEEIEREIQTNEENINETKPIDIDSPSLCAVIPLMTCRAPINPNMIDWENSSLETLTTVYENLLTVRHALITSKDIMEIQKLQQAIDETCKPYMEQFGFDIDYDTFVKDINKESTRNYPSEYRQFLLLSDVISIYDWIISNLKFYHELRASFDDVESYKKLRNVMFNGEVVDGAEAYREDVEDEEFYNTHWSPMENVFEEDDVSYMNEYWDGENNDEKLNNPDNMSDEDLRSIINSFNDEHESSGLIDDWNTRGV